MKRYFNTSGPNIPVEHYTLSRNNLIQKGISLVQNKRYFTIWAPRQTGKSTYFQLLAEKLNKNGYKAVYFSVEGFDNYTIEQTLERLNLTIYDQQQLEVNLKTLDEFALFFIKNKKDKFVLIIDEIESLNPSYFGQFLHTIRNLYHTRTRHCLKSVILVGATNIVGVVQDYSSPFNIADNLPIPYFTKEEIFELLEMHEKETNQLFDNKTKEKIAYITAGQPGLVNGFANKLVKDNPTKKIIDYEDYLKVEDWYLTEAIDKNIANIINKANQYRNFVESLLFIESKIPFKINREAIKVLHTNGIIEKDEDGYVKFWVPLYRKCLYDAFYPYSNGEEDLFFRNFDPDHIYKKDGTLIFDILIDNYKDYVKRRSFKYFRVKDKITKEYINLKESALAYSFETYIQAFIQLVNGKSYIEPHTGLGKCDLIININNIESIIEFKIYKNITLFREGKTQLAYYTKSISIKEAVYLIFVPNTITLPAIKEAKEEINGIMINTYIVRYDEEKDF